MKQSASVAPATTSPQADKAVRLSKPAGHAIAFFEHLQPKGMPASEAGPAVMVIPGALGQVEAAIESFRLAAALPSRIAGMARYRINGRLIHLSRKMSTDAERENVVRKLNQDREWGDMPQEDINRAWGRSLQIYACETSCIGTMLRCAIRDKDGDGHTPSVLVIQNVEEWGAVDLSEENLGNMLAAIYDRGAVYYADGAEPPKPTRKRTTRAAAAKPEEPPFDTNSDPDDDLPGDEWKRT